MTKQTSDRSSKSFPDPQASKQNRSPMVHKQDREVKNQGDYHVPDRMETFPKTRTFPKKWDFSSFSKDSK